MSRGKVPPSSAARLRMGWLLVAAGLMVGALIIDEGLTRLDSPGSERANPKRPVPDPAAPAPAPPTHVASGSAPNIALVLVDDMRWDELAWMPNVRHYLGDEGIKFRNSFAPYPLCCPGRATLLSGQFAHNHGVLSHTKKYGFHAFDDRQTLATAIQRAGYRTSFIGKYLNGYGLQKTHLGSEDSATYIPPGWDSWQGAVESNNRERSDPLFGGVYFYFDATMNLQGELTPMDGRYSTALFGELARETVTQEASGSKPWFMYLSLLAPHHGAPLEPDDPQPRWLNSGADPIWAGYFTPARPDWIKGSLNDHITKGLGVPLPGQPEELTSTKPDYLSALPPLDVVDRESILTISRQRAEALVIADDEFGRLVDTLRRTDQLDETVVAFTSDNGYFLGEQRHREGKIKPHEPSIRVPLLIRAPGLRPGVRDDPVSTPDLTATLLDYAAAAAPQEPDGRSMKDTLEGGDSGWVTPIMTESIISRVPPDPSNEGWPDLSSIGLRLAEWSYTLYATGEVEMYDMSADPNQLRNAHGDPAFRKEEASLERLLEQRTNCAGAACYEPLAKRLRLGPQQNSALTSHSVSAHEQRFGTLSELTLKQAAVILARRPDAF